MGPGVPSDGIIAGGKAPKRAPRTAPLPDTPVTGPAGLRVAPGLRVHKLADDDIAAYLEADKMDGDPDSDLSLIGNAQVRRIDTVIKGDRIDYHKASAEVEVVGGVRLMRDGTLVTGPHLRYNVDKDSGEIDDPRFYMGPQAGYATGSRADIYSRTTMRLTDATYSGCACEKPSWYIKSSQVDLDFDENEGVARNGVLYFKDVPILASPYMTFPVKKERKSGFLLPTYGSSTNAGFELLAPYYFNLAPNYDLTLNPRLLSKRGAQIGGEFRYMEPTYSGVLSGTYLSKDNMTGESRWLYTTKHRQILGGGFYADWDINGVSDDNYFRDFSSIGLNDASTTYLPRQGRVGWASNYWQSYVQVYKYQTLQDPDAPITPPYDKVPELYLKGARYDWGGLDAEWETTAVRFTRPELFGVRNGPNGDRLQSYPTISYPIVHPGWYIIPKAGVNYTQYNTSWYNGNFNGLAPGTNYPGSESRTLPIVSVDSGMTFERGTTLFGKDATQTLEPRLFYLRVPYRDQSKLPVYDTAVSDFSFAQAFQENLYSGGWDRISNANQLTAALTTRWLDAESGFERASLSLAQRFYFQDQKVTLPFETPRQDVRSDYLGGATAALTDTLSTEVAAQYNPYENKLSRALVSARWSPQRLTTAAISYRYQREPDVTSIYDPTGQNQVSVSFQWPFSARWYGVGRVDYSLRTVSSSDPATNQSPRVTQAIAGVEYKGDCCWTGRVVFQRYAVSTQETNTALFFQLELTGLGALGTDPLKTLSKSIPGYQNVNPATPSGSTFERYE
jgi:LPS-assembly protein